MNHPSKLQIVAKNLRGVARVWSVLVFILALILVIRTWVEPGANLPAITPLDRLIPISLLVSMSGLGIAWRWEGWGVLINLLFYLAVVPLYGLLHQEWLQPGIMVAFSPVILPGVLFGAAWLLTRKENSQG